MSPTHRPSTPPVALSIAGSDSGGGAGAQADLKTFAAHRVHGATALTAITAQSTAAVRGVVVLEPDFVRLQIETVLGDLSVRSVKTGMLATRAIVDVVADLAAAGRLPQLVVDPVLVSSSGHPLMDPDGIEAYLTRLIPHALVVTPNLREAAALTDSPLEDLLSVPAMSAAAERIRSHG
ncbi:MAG TPA: bifunctional hydroxymethylpyrimidine kinase/phosphomethylpyrimidine kinase, partial [Acidimicrobiales bacterium]|nr:bifunctional hydroxymethylpyrimidine kinase/phosphomethylpyrimidine kinase [Acidimicrobiales bacterium]